MLDDLRHIKPTGDDQFQLVSREFAGWLLVVALIVGAYIVDTRPDEVTGGVRDVSPPPVAVNEPDVPRPVRWPHPAGSGRDDAA